LHHAPSVATTHQPSARARRRSSTQTELQEALAEAEAHQTEAEKVKGQLKDKQRQLEETIDVLQSSEKLMAETETQRAKVKKLLQRVSSTHDSFEVPAMFRDTTTQQVEPNESHLPTGLPCFGSANRPATISASADSTEPAPNAAIELAPNAANKAAPRSRLAEVTNHPSGQSRRQQSSAKAAKPRDANPDSAATVAPSPREAGFS
jgi:hypothetical protein